jgi:acyl-CoA oxidase
MVADGANVAKKALTIAIRYGAIRRQFKTGNNPFETQLLDYTTHQRRLMPLVAQAIAMVSKAFLYSSGYARVYISHWNQSGIHCTQNDGDV